MLFGTDRDNKIMLDIKDWELSCWKVERYEELLREIRLRDRIMLVILSILLYKMQWILTTKLLWFLSQCSTPKFYMILELGLRNNFVVKPTLILPIMLS